MNVKQRVTNFGGNQTWEARYYEPKGEQEVLDILDLHAGEQIRPIGSKHSWSAAAATNGVGLRMNHFQGVQPFEKDGKHFVRVGAGTQLKNLLKSLHGQTERTLPTLGAITEQTISGATATGTHGSGKSSISHYIAGMRVAAYDPKTGKAAIREITGGDELKAARCGLGRMGVVLSMDLETVPKYHVSETVRQKSDLEDVLQSYEQFPLSQFTLFPHSWKYLAWERKSEPATELSLVQKAKAKALHLFNTVAVDVLYHAALKGAVWTGSPALLKGFMKLSPSLVMKDVTRTDEAPNVLTLKHDLFRHEEMEAFVPQSRLAEAVDVLKYATQVFSGEKVAAPPEVEKKLREIGMWDELASKQGSYVHHYPFYFRRVLPDDTLISMTASNQEPAFSISLFNYEAPEDREKYYDFCSFMARSLNQLCGARLHWGKHNPLGKEQLGPLYPELDKFNAIAGQHDPHGSFRNGYTDKVLGG